MNNDLNKFLKSKKGVFELSEFDKKYIEYLKNFFINKRENNDYVLKYNMRCSQVRDCPKKLLLLYYNLPEKINPNVFYCMSADFGTMIHEYVQNHLNNMGIILYEDDKLMTELLVEDEDLGITGHCDYLTKLNLISDIDSDEKVLGEIKTVHHDKFLEIVRKGKPLDYHLEQVNIYMHLLGLNYTHFIYINRGNSEFVSFLYKKNNKILDRAIKNCETVKNCIKYKTIPDEKMNDFKCMFCNYTEYCTSIQTIDDLYDLLDYLNNNTNGLF